MSRWVSLSARFLSSLCSGLHGSRTVFAELPGALPARWGLRLVSAAIADGTEWSPDGALLLHDV